MERGESKLDERGMGPSLLGGGREILANGAAIPFALGEVLRLHTSLS